MIHNNSPRTQQVLKIILGTNDELERAWKIRDLVYDQPEEAAKLGVLEAAMGLWQLPRHPVLTRQSTRQAHHAAAALIANDQDEGRIGFVEVFQQEPKPTAAEVAAFALTNLRKLECYKKIMQGVQAYYLMIFFSDPEHMPYADVECPEPKEDATDPVQTFLAHPGETAQLGMLTSLNFAGTGGPRPFRDLAGWLLRLLPTLDTDAEREHFLALAMMSSFTQAGKLFKIARDLEKAREGRRPTASPDTPDDSAGAQA